MELSSILLMLVVLFILARIGNRLFERFGVPGLIGEIIVGIIIANLVLWDGQTLIDMLNVSIPDSGILSDEYAVLYTFAELGVIFLLFSVGLETKVSELLSVGKSAMLVAILGVLLPFFFGFAYIQITEANYHHAMFLGAAMVATSVGITARVIKDMHLMEKRESKIIIGAAVIDDILGMIVLAIVKGTAGSDSASSLAIIKIIVEAVVFVLLAIAAARWLVPRLYAISEARAARYKERTGRKPEGFNMLILGVITCLLFSWFAENIGLAAIIGAFLAGMLFAEHAWETDMDRKVEAITSIFISYFFLYVGMQVDVSNVTLSVIGAAVIVIILAVISKLIGCGMGAKLGERDMDAAGASIIGIGMIPRGEVGIIVASIGLGITMSDGTTALSSELYTVIVLMAVATTIIAPPLLSKAYNKKYPHEFNVPSEDKVRSGRTGRGALTRPPVGIFS